MIIETLQSLWGTLQDRLLFLPPFPDQLDSLALFSGLLVVGLLAGEWLHGRIGLPKVVGYVLAGMLFGPSFLELISPEALAQTRPIADAALGLLLLEIGRRLDLSWLGKNPELLRGALGEVTLSFGLIFAYAWIVIGLSGGWSAATAAITMASAPAVVLLTAEETQAQGQVTERTVLYTSISCAASFIVFAFVLGFIHAENNKEWLNAVVHPAWVVVGALLIAWLAARGALAVASVVPKRSLSQVFSLVAWALFAVGIARMLAVPVFLTLFVMGVFLARLDSKQAMAHTDLPEGHWLLAIILFVVTGASLPWHELSWWTAFQAAGLLAVRAVAKFLGVWIPGGTLPRPKRLLIGMGIQPLSATAVFMASELVSLYPDVGRSALALPLFAAALMELIGPILCREAFRRAGETDIKSPRGGVL